MNTVQLKNKHARTLSFGESVLSILLRALPLKHGKHKILDMLTSSAWIKSDKPVSIAIQGHPIVVDPGDLVGWHFAMLRSFDPEVVELLSKVCDPEKEEVLWDIGANKGACFCSLASKVPSLRIVAVEPQGKLQANNIANLESLCPGRYEYVHAGLGDEEAELTLVIPHANNGRASFHKKKTKPDDEIETIKVHTATHIMRHSQFGWPTIIKIDVEGHEPQVFRSLQPCFATGICKLIAFENHAAEVNAFETMKTVTAPFGYQVFGITKSAWSTALVATQTQIPGVRDYALIRSDIATENKKITKLIH